MDMDQLLALAGLFAAAFAAATLVPFQSEVVLAAMLANETAPVWALFTAASLGNVLGSMANYALGRALSHFEDRWWFPATPAQMARAERWYLRWGVWTLLLSWAPFADPLTVVAGVLRTPFWLFTLLVGIAKTGRYAAVIWLCGVTGWC